MTDQDSNRVFVHVVTFNSASWIEACLSSVLAQDGFSPGTLRVVVTDNASTDDTSGFIRSKFGSKIEVRENSQNLGFCGGHNLGVKLFLESGFERLLILNPDVRLDKLAIGTLASSLSDSERIGVGTGKLFRADDSLNPVGDLLDAAGMTLTPSLRHFDRGSNEADRYFEKEIVFGATGAFMMLTRQCVEELLLVGTNKDSLKYLVCPELQRSEALRAPLFDEAFFAYREDADLCWRANLLGWKAVFEPQSKGFHKRVVLSTNRSSTSAHLNGLSVRNRFLMQLNNAFGSNLSMQAVLLGLLVRNLFVLLGVLLRERSSLRYLWSAIELVPRALERRKILRSRSTLRSKIV